VTGQPPKTLRDGRYQGWWWIHNHTLDVYAKQVGASAWLVYCYLVRRADKAGKSFPAIATIASDTGLSRNTVKTSIATLEGAGLLHVEERTDDAGRSTSHRYTVRAGEGPNSDPHLSNSDTSEEADSDPSPGQILTPNNTHVNETHSNKGLSLEERLEHDAEWQRTQDVLRRRKGR
jgi:DNA-binding transcriptional MocR family regulator